MTNREIVETMFQALQRRDFDAAFVHITGERIARTVARLAPTAG